MAIVSVGEVFHENKDGPFELVEVVGGKTEVSTWCKKSDVKVRFLDTGSEKVIGATSLSSENIRDDCKPRIMGVGFMGSGKYRARRPQAEGGKKYKSYECWENMMWRVYGKHRLENRYSGLGVTVCSEWHNFQNFCDWYLENKPEGDGYVLDKDVLKTNNSVYSPEFCRFIPQELNKFFGSMNLKRGKYPVGVCECGDRFAAKIQHSDQGSAEYFDTPEMAFSWYKELKEFVLQQLSDKMYHCGKIPKDIYEACQRWQVVPYPR